MNQQTECPFLAPYPGRCGVGMGCLPRKSAKPEACGYGSDYESCTTFMVACLSRSSPGLAQSGVVLAEK